MTGGAAGVTVKVDVAAGAAYVSLPGAADAEVFRTLELRDDVLVDVDEHGTLIGIEILSLNLTDPIPPVVPAGQEVLSDLAARLAAADIDWARALGDHQQSRSTSCGSPAGPRYSSQPQPGRRSTAATSSPPCTGPPWSMARPTRQRNATGGWAS